MSRAGSTSTASFTVSAGSRRFSSISHMCPVWKKTGRHWHTSQFWPSLADTNRAAQCWAVKTGPPPADVRPSSQVILEALAVLFRFWIVALMLPPPPLLISVLLRPTSGTQRSSRPCRGTVATALERNAEPAKNLTEDGEWTPSVKPGP